jgi:hypothetical protein
MRPDIYSCSSSNKRIRLKVGFQNNKNSEPPPNNSANRKSVGEQRHGSGLHFALVTMLSFLSTSSPFLVTVNSSQRVFCVLDLSKRLSKRVSVKDSGLISSCRAVFKNVWDSPRDSYELATLVMRKWKSTGRLNSLAGAFALLYRHGVMLSGISVARLASFPLLILESEFAESIPVHWPFTKIKITSWKS